MDGVERLAQMNEVERMREIMGVISNNMRKQNDKDRMEMLAMLASTTATETNLMSVNFARRANTQATGTKTKKNKGKALIKGVEQAENDKDKADKATSQTQSNNQSNQNKPQPNQPPANTLATRTQPGKGKVVAITVLDNRFNKEFCRNKEAACISLDRSPVTHISEAIERGLSSLGFSVNQRSDTIMQIGINNFYISCFMVTHCAALFLSCLTCFYITQFI